MRLIPLVPVLILFLSGASSAQEWIEYASRADLFTVNFPAQPTVREITYPTEYGLTIPGRVHSYEDGKNRYSVTVVDYGNVQKLHAERLANCQKYPNLCNNPYVGELRGALDYAAWGFMQRDAKVTHYAYYNTDRVEGRRIQLTNADRSRTFAAIHMHENRLYILEGTVPPGAPPPGLFQQSLGFLDTKGIRIRYNSVYSNMYPPPPRVQYQAPQSEGQQGR
jgi:hypothetical protein